MKDRDLPSLVLFTWHSKKNIDLIIPFLEYLRQSLGFQIYVITTQATGKFYLINHGFQAFTVNEIAACYPSKTTDFSKSNMVPEPCIDLLLDWLYTPQDPALLPGPKRDTSADYYLWKRDQVLSAYRGFLSDCAPTAVFTWNGAFLVTGALADAAHELEIPCYFLERGLLPESLIVDPQGVNAKSVVTASDWKSAATETFDETTKQLMLDYCNHIAASNRSVVNIGKSLSDKEVRQHLAIPDNHKVILLALQIETDSNIVLHSPIYKRMTDVIADVVEAVRAIPNTTVVVKPHPEDKRRADEIEQACQSGPVVCCWDLDLPSVLAITDLTIVINSTVGLEAAIHNIPVITLGNAAYSGKGFSSSLGSKSQLPSLIQEGLKGACLPWETEAFPQFLYLLMYRCTFFYDENKTTNVRKVLSDELESYKKKELSPPTSHYPTFRSLLDENEAIDLLWKKGDRKVLIVGTVDHLSDQMPQGVTVITRSSPKSMILRAFLTRFDLKIFMEYPNNKMFRLLTTLFSAKRTFIFG